MGEMILCEPENNVQEGIKVVKACPICGVVNRNYCHHEGYGGRIKPQWLPHNNAAILRLKYAKGLLYEASRILDDGETCPQSVVNILNGMEKAVHHRIKQLDGN